jgi:hypothetical protein
VLITGLSTTSDDACYRAMDWLLEIREPLEKAVFDTAAEVLDLEVDLLFFDYPANNGNTGEVTADGRRFRPRMPGPHRGAHPRKVTAVMPVRFP